VDELILAMTARDFALRFYTGMLRLYPPQFRAEYAAEMRDVFTQSLHEKENTLSLMSLLLAEMRDLPISVIREYIREKQNMRATDNGIVLESERLLIDQFRFCVRASVGVACIYFLLIVLPFFIFGLHLQPPDDIRRGLFPPGDYSIYHFDSPLGGVLRLVSFCVMFFAPLGEILFGGVLVLSFARRRIQLTVREGVGGWLAAMISIGLLLFTISPLGNLITIWWFG
jgi:hypothetical protein